MMKSTLTIWIIFAAAHYLSATAICTDCDSLVTKSGKVYMVHSPYIIKDKLKFIMCNDSSEREVSMPLRKVYRVGKNVVLDEYLHPKEDPLLTEGGSIKKWISIGMFLLITVILTPAGYLLLVIGFLKSERLLRKLKKQEDHPDAEALKKLAKRSILIAWILMFLPLLIYFLLLL